MNTDEHGLKYSGVTQEVIGVFFDVYHELGPGFLESVYVRSMVIALLQRALTVEREKPLIVRFRGHVVGNLRTDLVVGGVVLVEVKACPKLNPLHEAQILNYLRATSLEIGLLVKLRSPASVQARDFRQSTQDQLSKASPGVKVQIGSIRVHLWLLAVLLLRPS